MKTKAASIKLSDMTCSQLADWLEKGPDATTKECKKTIKLRELYNNETDIRRLRLLQDLPARRFRSGIRHAAIVDSAPVIKLVIGGGTPKHLKGPRFTKRAKEIASKNGMSLHRWTGGFAFFTRKEQGEALQSFTEEKSTQPTLI